MRGTVDTRQHNMNMIVPATLCHSLSVQRARECNHNWAGKLTPRHVCKPNQQWWINVVLLRVSSFSLPTLLPCTLSNIHHLPFAASQISFHPSLYVPLMCRLFNRLILLIDVAELFLRCSTDSVHVKFDGAGTQTDLPGRGVHQ